MCVAGRNCVFCFEVGSSFLQNHAETRNQRSAEDHTGRRITLCRRVHRCCSRRQCRSRRQTFRSATWPSRSRLKIESDVRHAGVACPVMNRSNSSRNCRGFIKRMRFDPRQEISSASLIAEVSADPSGTRWESLADPYCISRIIFKICTVASSCARIN